MKDNFNLEKLIKKLKEIKKKGYVKSLRAGSTGIGFTLESLLNIKENRSRNPDWGEYEIKTKRKGKSNHSSLFVPKIYYLHYNNWKEMVEDAGEPFIRGEREGKSLLHGVPYKIPERNGWWMKFDENYQKLNIYKNIDEDNTIHIGYINTDEMKTFFYQKLKKTVWIYADYKMANNEEFFHYNEVYLLEDPSFNKFIMYIMKNLIFYEMRLYYYRKHPRDKKYESHGNAFRANDNIIFKLYNIKQRIL
ncbi:MAG: MvaI/BcnI family restriction endonuclease [Promethearchaeota archaeon]